MKKVLLALTIALTGCAAPDYSKGDYNGNTEILISFEGVGINPLLLADSIINNSVQVTHQVTINDIDYGTLIKGECARITMPAGIYTYAIDGEDALMTYGFEANTQTTMTVKTHTYGTATLMMIRDLSEPALNCHVIN